MDAKTCSIFAIFCIFLTNFEAKGQHYQEAESNDCFDVTCPSGTRFCKKTVADLNLTTTKTSIECFGAELTILQEFYRFDKRTLRNDLFRMVDSVINR